MESTNITHGDANTCAYSTVLYTIRVKVKVNTFVLSDAGDERGHQEEQDHRGRDLASPLLPRELTESVYDAIQEEVVRNISFLSI